MNDETMPIIRAIAPTPPRVPFADVTHTYRFNDGHGEPIAECKLVRRPSGTLWIASLWVHPRYRSQGYGTKLLDQVVTEWGNDETLYLIVNPYTDQPLDVSQLHDWYARWGFDFTTVPDVLKREEDE